MSKRLVPLNQRRNPEEVTNASVLEQMRDAGRSYRMKWRNRINTNRILVTDYIWEAVVLYGAAQMGGACDARKSLPVWFGPPNS